MKKAFTLIELLVVIAIIAILAAILFPVFAQAKAAAKTTATLSGLKQVDLAILMYTNDYDDTMPQPTGVNCQLQGDPNCYYDDPTTLEVLYPYVKNAHLFWDVSGGVYPGPEPMVDDGPLSSGLLYAWGWWDWNITVTPNADAANWWNGTDYVPRVTSSQQFGAELSTLAVIRAPGYNNDAIGAPQWIGDQSICSNRRDDLKSPQRWLETGSASSQLSGRSIFISSSPGGSEGMTSLWSPRWWTFYNPARSRSQINATFTTLSARRSMT